MTCPAPTNVALKYLSGPNALRLKWKYTGAHPISFTVQLERQRPPDPLYYPVDATHPPGTVRNIRWIHVDIQTGDTFRAWINALCQGCVASSPIYSNTELIP